MNDRVKKLIEQMTMEEKLQCLHGQQWDKYRANQAGFVKGIERLGIPDIFVADGESGVNTSWEATGLPSKVGLAASFDRKAARLYGEVIGREAKASGMNWMLTPRVNIVRDYACAMGKSNGGNYQTYGEDPVLNGELGAQEAMGIQSDNNAIANVKQLFGTSSGSAQGAGNCVIDLQTMHEIYMKVYEPVFKAGVGSAMTSYNQVNGTWTYDHAYMNTRIIRDTWGFEGIAVDDWNCLYDPNSIRHGVTMEMPGEDYYDEGNEKSWYGKRLLDCVNDPNQPVTEADINRAVGIYLSTLDRFGMLDRQRIPGPIDQETIKQGIIDAREIAGKTAVLLKNEDGILPIDPEKETVAIIGPTGNRQALPIFKEAAYAITERLTGAYQVLDEIYPGKITYAVGNDMDGVIVPSEFLKPENGSAECGLKRYLTGYTYQPLGDGRIDEVPVADEFVIDKTVNFTGENALDSIQFELMRGHYKSTPRPYYMWHGYICPKETGEYRLSVQSYIPGVKEFEKNNVSIGDMFISTSGNLYVKLSERDEYLSRVAIGTRIAANGGAVPNSEVVTCLDGFNNAGGTVYMEAGKEYEIYFNQCCIYHEPVQVRFAWTTPSMMEEAIVKAAETAGKADRAVVFAWHKSPFYCMELQERQNDLIRRVAKANPNTIVVLNTGDPVEMPWLDEVKAVLEMWLSGQEGARATADVLLGKVNPAGRLPVTFPRQLTDSAVRDPKHPERYAEPGRILDKDAIHMNVAVFTEGLNIGYRHFDEYNIEPRFEFGYGLSYTKFAYGDTVAEMTSDGGYQITCDITNVGEAKGDEVVQCYLTRPIIMPQGIKASPKVLVDFVRRTFEPGETQSVALNVSSDQLLYFDSEKKDWVPLCGQREILIGASSRDIKKAIQIEV